MTTDHERHCEQMTADFPTPGSFQSSMLSHLLRVLIAIYILIFELKNKLDLRGE